MLRLVAKGAKLRCADGATPCTLKVMRVDYLVDGHAIANVEDHKPAINIDGFGMCKCMQNPAVAAATAANKGALTPMPCKPPSFSEWTPGAKYIYQDVDGRNVRALTNECTCSCAYGPTVEIVDPATDLNVEA